MYSKSRDRLPSSDLMAAVPFWDLRVMLPVVVAEQAVENGWIAIDENAFDSCENQRLVVVG